MDSKQGGAFDNTQTVDLSAGGMGFLSQNRVPLNKEIAVELDLEENEKPVFVIGKVQWVKPITNSSQYRIGIRFKDVLSGSKSYLKKYFTDK